MQFYKKKEEGGMEFKGHKKKQRKELCLWRVGTKGRKVSSEPFVARFKSYMDH